MRGTTKLAYAGALVLLGVFFGSSEASAQHLSISPTRVELDTNQQSAELVLSNRGTARGTYRIEFTHKRMTEDGEFIDVDEGEGPELRLADDLVVYAPRQVVLEPGSSQRIRVMLRNTRNLEPGEYRTRLAFKSVPNLERASAAPQQQTTDNGVPIKLQIVSAVTIPLIVRHGKLSSRAQIADLQLHDDPPEGASRRFEGQPVKWLTFDLLRWGNRSLYGDVTVLWIPEEGAKPVVVGKSRGIGVYTEIDKRRIKVPIMAPQGRSFDSGRLVVGFHPSGSKRVTAQDKLDL